MNREQLVKRAADAIANTTDHPGMGHVDWPDQFDAAEIAKVCWSVFEETHAPTPCPVCPRADGSHKLDCRPQNRRDAAHAPTDDERDALRDAFDSMHRITEGGCDTEGEDVADMVIALGFRRTVQGEPSDEARAIIRQARDFATKERDSIRGRYGAGSAGYAGYANACDDILGILDGDPSVHDRDRDGICLRCGHGLTAAELLDGETTCEPQGEPSDAQVEAALGSMGHSGSGVTKPVMRAALRAAAEAEGGNR